MISLPLHKKITELVLLVSTHAGNLLFDLVVDFFGNIPNLVFALSDKVIEGQPCTCAKGVVLD